MERKYFALDNYSYVTILGTTSLPIFIVQAFVFFRGVVIYRYVGQSVDCALLFQYTLE